MITLTSLVAVVINLLVTWTCSSRQMTDHLDPNVSLSSNTVNR